MTHICVGKLTIIGSDNGLSPERRQAIIWTNAGILLIGPLGTNFSEILIGIQTFSFKKMHLKTSSATWRLFGLGLNELTHWSRVSRACIVSDNGMSPVPHKPIIRNNADLMLIGLLGKKFHEFIIKIRRFSSNDLCLKLSSVKRSPRCLMPQCVNRRLVQVNRVIKKKIKGIGNGMHKAKSVPCTNNVWVTYIDMCKCKTAETTLLTHWRYCSFALGHRCKHLSCWIHLRTYPRDNTLNPPTSPKELDRPWRVTLRHVDFIFLFWCNVVITVLV